MYGCYNCEHEDVDKGLYPCVNCPKNDNWKKITLITRIRNWLKQH